MLSVPRRWLLRGSAAVGLGRLAAFFGARWPSPIRPSAFGDDEIVPPDVRPAPPNERHVGVDYTLWHYKADWPSWVTVWGKPELGYYASADRAVIRKHAGWLTDAGADFILLDWSNQLGADDRTRAGVPWQLYIEDATRALFEEYGKLPQHPKIAFLLGNPRAPEAITDGRLQAKADQVHAEFVENAAFRPILQDYLGKPLVVVYVDTPSPYQNGPPPWSDPRFTVRFMTSFLSQQPKLLWTRPGQPVRILVVGGSRAADFRDSGQPS